MMPTIEPTLELLNRLVGTWMTDASHPALPGVDVHGTVVIEWLEGERFLIYRGRTDHPDFPDSISVIGNIGRDRVDAAVEDGGAVVESQLCMHYFDSRGVFRVYAVAVDDVTLRFWRDARGFSQRFAGT